MRGIGRREFDEESVCGEWEREGEGRGRGRDKERETQKKVKNLYHDLFHSAQRRGHGQRLETADCVHWSQRSLSWVSRDLC